MMNELELNKKWQQEAKEQTLETLPEWLKGLAEHQHDYGTICRAVAAAAIGAASAINKSPNGGITGFQAGCVMWDFIEGWMQEKGPKRLVNYDNMLFPQYEHSFEKTISFKTMEYLCDEAKKKLAESKDAHPNVIEHWKFIAAGNVPFGYTVEAKQ